MPYSACFKAYIWLQLLSTLNAQNAREAAHVLPNFSQANRRRTPQFAVPCVFVISLANCVAHERLIAVNRVRLCTLITPLWTQLTATSLCVYSAEHRRRPRITSDTICESPEPRLDKLLN
jgi:hypothetical protein